MDFKIYKPTDTILHPHAIYRGTILADIFKYQPEYIENAILKYDDFAIDMEAFEKLPLPTPILTKLGYEESFTALYVKKLDIQFDGRTWIWPTGNNLLALIAEFSKMKGFKPKKFHFKFSVKTQKINEEKIDENYFEPHFELPDHDYEREYFNVITDGQLGDYNDFKEKGGDLDDIDDWSGR
jgi:hypothetical protein